jgi:outer membrane protein assembly factor BamB
MCAILFSSCSNISKQSKSWPQFRGNNSTGIAYQNAKPPTELGEDNMLWKIETPTGHSSPVIWDNNIFISGCHDDENKLLVMCISRKKGEILWRDSIVVEEFEKVHAVGNTAQSSPVTDGERVYFYFGSYGLLCYDLAGQLLWKKEFEIPQSMYGVASSPIINEDLLILCRDVGSEKVLYAFDKISGNIVWKTDLPERAEFYDSYSSHSTPVIWENSIVLHRAQQVSAFIIDNGEPDWIISLATNGNSAPVFSDDIMYFGAWTEVSESNRRWEAIDFEYMIDHYDGNNDGLIEKSEIPEDMIFFDRPEMRDLQNPFYLKNFTSWYDQNRDGYSNKEEWDSFVELYKDLVVDGGLFAIKPGIQKELTFENIVWKVNEDIPEVPSPILYNGLIYMCKNGGIITCMNAEDGEIIYKDRLGAPGPYFASPIAANGYIYFPSLKGKITVIKAGPELEVIAQSDLDEDISSTPAIIGKSIYIRTSEHLIAFSNN